MFKKNSFSNQNFKICYEYIKNNSYNNLNDGNHIWIIWSCSNSAKTLNVSYIPFKILITCLPIAKTLIKYKPIIGGNDKDEKEPLILSLLS